MSKVSGYGWSVTVEVLHYLVSLVGVSFFSGDIVIPAGSLVIAYFAVNPLMWSWRSSFEEALPFWEDVRREPVRSVGKFLVSLVLALGFPLICVAAVVWAAAWLKYNPYSDDFTYFSGAPMLTNVSCPFLWEDPLANV